MADEVEDVPEKLPAHLSCESWKSATIDLSVFGLQPVHLKDGSRKDVQSWAECAGKPIGTAKMFAAYIDSCEDATWPNRGSGWNDWQKFIDSGAVSNKPIRAIEEGILGFIAYVGREGGKVPNS